MADLNKIAMACMASSHSPALLLRQIAPGLHHCILYPKETFGDEDRATLERRLKGQPAPLTVDEKRRNRLRAIAAAADEGGRKRVRPR